MNDSYYWKVLVAMYRDRPEEMEFWTNAVTRRKTYGTTVSSWKTWVLQYEIWKIVRMFDLQKRRPENPLNIINLFTVSEKSSLFQASLRLPTMLEDASESGASDAPGNDSPDSSAEDNQPRTHSPSNQKPVGLSIDIDSEVRSLYFGTPFLSLV